jgi:purine catabolism regulator
MADPTAHRLRLADLLAEDSLGLELLTGGPDAPTRDVRGAHAVEVDGPARWLGPDWVMLTTGVRLRGHADAQRRLVAELEAGEASALGFGVGLRFKRVPAALVEVAQEREFPIFTVPYETPFREIIHFVDSSLTSGEEQLYRRLTALQRYLVDALRMPQPERALVERLARFLDARVMLVGADGRPEIVAGKPPFDEVPPAICADPPEYRELDIAGWHVVATPVVARADQSVRRLVLASRRRGMAHRLARPAVEATAPLLAAAAQLSDVVRDQEQAVKAALLAEALAPPEARAALALGTRAAAFGLDFAQPARLVVIRRDHRRAGEPPPDLAAIRCALISELERARVAHLVCQRDASLTALVQGGEREVRAALDAVSDSRPDALIGIGRTVTAIVDARQSLRDAELAVDRAGLDPERRIMHFADLDLGRFIVSEIPPERLRPKVDEILAGLRANAPLYEALTAYFAHDLDIASTAESLHMHRNSLRYRLARAEQVLGRSLKDPATIAAVYIALVAEAVEPP